MRKKGNKVDGQAHTLRNCSRSFRVSRPGAAGLRPPTGTDRHRAAMVTECIGEGSTPTTMRPSSSSLVSARDSVSLLSKGVSSCPASVWEEGGGRESRHRHLEMGGGAGQGGGGCCFQPTCIRMCSNRLSANITSTCFCDLNTLVRRRTSRRTFIVASHDPVYQGRQEG